MRWLMGTLWEIETDRPAEEAVTEAFAEIRRLDALLSHYQADSVVSRLNRTGDLVVPLEVADLLQRCLTYTKASGGAFDVTVAPLVELWGFKHQDYRLPSSEAMAAAKTLVGPERVQLDGQRVRLLPGTRIEFGAVGKGYALDRAMAVLRRHGLSRARIDAGGQHIVAGNWTVAIRHPRKDGERLGRLVVMDGWSVSTSGDDERGFEHEGKRYGHVIDPRTGWPAPHYPSVTVVAPTAELADVLSTVAAILGPDQGAAMLGQYRAEALWYRHDGTTQQTPGFTWQPEPVAN